ncbi:MAG: BREX-3 system P-loop-containing protein BrxF [Chloroflexi bacterium]|nr:BREX-3 system P-loop-containing protein BrxF [Chloroflexota bacterium]
MNNREDMQQSIQDFLTQNQRDLIILVHPVVQNLEDAYNSLTATNQWQSISIGKSLSADMISGKVSGPSAVQTWLVEQVRGMNPSPVLLHGIDLLFEPSFKLNPLAIFKQASRFTPLIVFWPGTFTNQVLAYAVPEHHHYRTWRKPEASIMNL